MRDWCVVEKDNGFVESLIEADFGFISGDAIGVTFGVVDMP